MAPGYSFVSYNGIANRHRLFLPFGSVFKDLSESALKDPRNLFPVDREEQSDEDPDSQRGG